MCFTECVLLRVLCTRVDQHVCDARLFGCFQYGRDYIAQCAEYNVCSFKQLTCYGL